MKRIELLEKLASELVGDGKSPNLYFVTVEGNCVLVSIDFDVAYDYWKYLPRDVETALEDRFAGIICSTEPIEDGSKQLITYDDSRRQ